MGAACVRPSPPPYAPKGQELFEQQIRQLRHRFGQYIRSRSAIHAEAMRHALARVLKTPIDMLPFSTAALSDTAEDALMTHANSPYARLAYHRGIVTEV